MIKVILHSYVEQLTVSDSLFGALLLCDIKPNKLDLIQLIAVPHTGGLTIILHISD